MSSSCYMWTEEQKDERTEGQKDERTGRKDRTEGNCRYNRSINFPKMSIIGENMSQLYFINIINLHMEFDTNFIIFYFHLPVRNTQRCF
jgi:hypothetical protein